MNIINFKSEIRKMEYNSNSLQMFRKWATTVFVQYKMNMELEEENIKLHCPAEECKSDIYNDFEYQWKYLSFDDLCSIYCGMGWELNEEIISKKSEYNESGDDIFYNFDGIQILEKIFNCEDTLEFMFGILLFVQCADESRQLYKEFGKKIRNGLNECNLPQIFRLTESKKETVFIAMSFSEEMNKARRQIAAAIQECDFEPVLIDVKEHNNQIVPEIFKEIEKSKFVVADLTEQRGGVYYEAGIAGGKDKAVILTCKKEEIDKVHFDLAQVNTIFWEDERDLKDRLIKRIHATIK